MDFKSWELVIGLEIHAQLKTKTKLFSPEKAGWTQGENDQVHPVSLALPGTLPVLNEAAVKMALKTAKAFKGKIQTESRFARKNYFYPDLPKGYQISQYDKAFCEGGRLDFYCEKEKSSVSLERIHLEEDSGSSLHQGAFSLINFNRAGVPLLEIVTQPVLRQPLQASACVKAIRRTLRYLEVCDGNLEEGSLRCDCNISVRKKGERAFGTRVELKNLNSFRFIEKALLYEAKRQIEVLKAGLKVEAETRLYDSSKNQTRPMRSKEEVSDYRYFPEPDLPQVYLSPQFLKDMELPELPFEKKCRFIEEYKLSLESAEILTEDKLLADYFEEIVKKTKEPQQVSHWLTGELQAHLKEKGLSLCPIPVEDFASLLNLVSKGDISNKMAKEIFAEMWETGSKPEQIVEKKNLKQISSSEELEELVHKVLTKYPDQIKDYKGGRTKLFGFFIGQIMKETKGQAHPQKVSNILKQKLEELCE